MTPMAPVVSSFPVSVPLFDFDTGCLSSDSDGGSVMGCGSLCFDLPLAFDKWKMPVRR